MAFEVGLLAVWVGVVADGPVVGPVEAERARLREHFARIDVDFGARDVSHLSAELKAAREWNLARLREYADVGVFPHNYDFSNTRVPYFIDVHDTACAVGHLMIESGHEELAREIQRVENNAYLGDIQTPGALEWIGVSGLTVQECARIQPSYCYCGPEDEPVCGVDGRTYRNGCVATECAGVEIAHEGECAVPEGSDEWPEPEDTGKGSDSGTSTGDGGDDGAGNDGGGDDGGDDGAGDDGAGDGGDDGDDDAADDGAGDGGDGGVGDGGDGEAGTRGCTCGTTAVPPTMWLWLALPLLARRRA